MRLLVLSDSHGSVERMEEVIDREKPDRVLHLGDYQRDAEQLRTTYFRLPVVCLAGNCDYGSPGPQSYLDELEGVRIFACHGHRQQVKSGLLSLKYAASEVQAALCFFGHTHSAFCETVDGITFLNPGAIGGYRPSYAVVTLKDGAADCRIIRL